MSACLVLLLRQRPCECRHVRRGCGQDVGIWLCSVAEAPLLRLQIWDATEYAECSGVLWSSEIAPNMHMAPYSFVSVLQPAVFLHRAFYNATLM